MPAEFPSVGWLVGWLVGLCDYSFYLGQPSSVQRIGLIPCGLRVSSEKEDVKRNIGRDWLICDSRYLHKCVCNGIQRPFQFITSII
ncbi:hypothetical protein GGS20DRAFT_540966 [Poronia punctata]|nr:hypothetical protein GGS20DRAFT_540966 [Poronia punctata]